MNHLLCCLLLWVASLTVHADIFNPTPPAEPGDVVTSRLYLVSDPEGACTFSVTSGTAYKVGSAVTVKATPGSKYTFLGWYQADMLMSTELTYKVTAMPYHDMTLTARLERIPDPVTPPAPNKYAITVAAADELSATVTGAGTYSVGTSISVKATPKRSEYKFDYWTKNGERTDLAQTFTFKLTDDDGNVDFVAYFRYDPALPDEPSILPIKSRLYLQSDPEKSCVFSRTSGSEVTVGTEVSVKATPMADYVFQGWYQGDLLVGEELTYVVAEMPYNDMTLTARFSYEPAPPPPPVITYSVSASVGAGTGGTVQCSGSKPKDGAFEVGSTMTLKATPASGFRFLYWTKNTEQTDLPQNFSFTLLEADGNLSFVAWFMFDPSALPDEPEEPEPDPDHETPDVAQSVLSLEQTELSLAVGEKFFLEADLDPFDERAVFTWESSDASVATVDPTGLITALAVGTTTISVSLFGQTASCEVTVTKPVQLGDVNLDERVSITDVVTLIAHLRGQQPAPFEIKAADVDANKTVDDEDVKALVKLLLQ